MTLSELKKELFYRTIWYHIEYHHIFGVVNEYIIEYIMANTRGRIQTVILPRKDLKNKRKMENLLLCL